MATLNSILNLTTTPLDNGETYTGKWEDANDYYTVIAAALADQSGVLTIEQTSQGSTGPDTIRDVQLTESLAVVADTGASLTVTFSRQYFRVKFFNNSGSNQTSMDVSSRLSNATIATATSTEVVSILESDWTHGGPDYNTVETVTGLNIVIPANKLVRFKGSFAWTMNGNYTANGSRIIIDFPTSGTSNDSGYIAIATTSASDPFYSSARINSSGVDIVMSMNAIGSGGGDTTTITPLLGVIQAGASDTTLSMTIRPVDDNVLYDVTVKADFSYFSFEELTE